MSVILPGSYDPVTNGHLDIIRRAAKEYDEVYVVVFNNPKKNYTFMSRSSSFIGVGFPLKGLP